MNAYRNMTPTASFGPRRVYPYTDHSARVLPLGQWCAAWFVLFLVLFA